MKFDCSKRPKRPLYIRTKFKVIFITHFLLDFSGTVSVTVDNENINKKMCDIHAEING